MTYTSPKTDLPPHVVTEARRAALMGTRALIATESFDALVALLVAAEVIPAERMKSCLTDLSFALKGHARGHPEWAVEPAELRIHAERLAARAEQLSGSGHRP